VLRQRRAGGDWVGAEAVARKLLLVDPLNEDATMLLAESALLSGARAEAVQRLDRYLEELGEAVPEGVRRRVATLRRRIHEPAPAPSRVREVPLDDRHFVGRDREFAELSRGLRRARWQDGSAVLVHGVPGIGKSRLVQELGRVALIEGFREVRLACREGDETSRFQLLAELVARLLALPGALGCSPEGLRRLRQQWPDGARADASDAPVDGASGGAGRVDPVEQAAFREALVDLVAAIAEERPLLLVVEDVHWLDAGSWQVLQLFAGTAATSRLLLVFTSRTRMPPQLRDVALAPRLALLALAPLPAAAATQLTTALVEGSLGSEEAVATVDARTPDPTVPARLAGMSEGNPLFLRALVRHWLATGEVDAVPRTITGLLETQMNRLPPSSLMALQAITLLGALSTTERLVAVLGVPTLALLEALDDLTTADCIRSAPPNHVTSHDLVGRVALGRLSPPARAVLHGAIADTLRRERQGLGTRGLLLPMLEQLALAGRSAEWALAVVEEQEGVLGAGNPAPLLAQAAMVEAHAPATLQAPAVRGVLAQLQAQAGNYEESLRLAGDVVGLSGQVAVLGEREAAALLAYLDSSFSAYTGADHRFTAQVSAELSENVSLPVHQRLSAARRGLVIANNLSDRTLAERCYRSALELEVEDEDHAWIEFQMIYACDSKHFDAAEVHARNLLAAIDCNVPSIEKISSLFCAGAALRRCGRIQEAILALNASSSMVSKLNVWTLSIDIAMQRASIARGIGEFAEAKHWEETIRDSLKVHDNKSPYLNAIAYLCRAAIESNNLTLAHEHVAEFRKVLPKWLSSVAQLHLCSIELGYQMLNGAQAISEDILDAGLRAFENTNYGWNDFPVAILSSGLEMLGRADEGNRLIIEYVVNKRMTREPLAVCLRHLAEKAGLRVDANGNHC
jgi:hypothetical protein